VNGDAGWRRAVSANDGSRPDMDQRHGFLVEFTVGFDPRQVEDFIDKD
jgi:hypothetical protein